MSRLVLKPRPGEIILIQHSGEKLELHPSRKRRIVFKGPMSFMISREKDSTASDDLHGPKISDD